MTPNNQKRNIISEISLAKILFEEEGGGDYSTPSDIGSFYSGTGDGGYGGGGGGSVGEFYKTFVAPFGTLFGALGYSTEKIANAAYYFTKKILVNIPRLFNPVTPLIFDDIKDEEKASYKRLDQRYAAVLKEVNQQLKNTDIKALAFLYAPQSILAGTFITKTPKVAYKVLNVLTGNKVNDLITNVKNAYYSIPRQQRSKERIEQLVRFYSESDRSTNEKLDEQYIFEKATKPLGNDTFLATFYGFFKKPIENMAEPALQQIQAVGKESVETLISKIKTKLGEVEVALKKTNPKDFAEAAGVKDINSLKTNIEKAVNDTLAKQNQTKKSDENVEKTKDQILAQINQQVLGQLKQSYINSIKTDLSNSRSKLQQLSVSVPDYKQQIEEILKEIDNLLK